MKLYAPKYYENFKCIADKCTHSCCVGWEIDIDNDTLKKYACMKGEYAKEIKKSIDKTDTPHFRLLENDRCPHLDENGLCKIILSCGEDYLCDICREHPRFYNYTNYGKEAGLGIACEEACRIILTSDDYDRQIEIGEMRGRVERVEFDSIFYRSKIYAILKSSTLSYIEKLRAIYDEFNVSPDALTDKAWKECINSLEYLDDSHRSLLLNYSSNLDTPSQLEKPLERALAYFIYRHCTEEINENEYRIALGFCLFCERLLASIAKNNKKSDIITLAIIVSEEIEYSLENTDAIKKMII